MNLKDLGIRIKARRNYLKKTQAQIASAIGTSRANYARYEAGDVDINVTTLEAIAKALKVPKRYLDPEDSDEWAPEGAAAEFFEGVPPDIQPMVLEMIRAATAAAKRAESTHGRKAE